MAGLSAHTDWISCTYLAQFPRLPFCRVIYIQLLHLLIILQAKTSTPAAEKARDQLETNLAKIVQALEQVGNVNKKIYKFGLDFKGFFHESCFFEEFPGIVTRRL